WRAAATSKGMGFLPVFVHEMFHSSFGARAGRAAIAQVEHEAGIAHRLAAENGCGHARAAQEDFDFSDQHGRALLSGLSRGCDSLSHPGSRVKSYLSRKNLWCRNQ